MPSRTEDDHLRLLCRIVERIAQEPAWGEPFTIELRFEAGTSSISTHEPQRPDMRSLLMEVRKLDQPGDASLPDLLDIVAARVVADTDRRAIRRMRTIYDRLQATDDIRLDDGHGEISARTAFELWAYGEHLHDDVDKEARLAAMPVEMATFVRQNAVRYMQRLVHMAAFLRAVILEDPVLQAIVK
jgi:hypothetical protein